MDNAGDRLLACERFAFELHVVRVLEPTLRARARWRAKDSSDAVGFHIARLTALLLTIESLRPAWWLVSAVVGDAGTAGCLCQV